MEEEKTSFLPTFDREDRELLELVDPLLSGQKQKKQLRRLFDPHLHPRGIKELAAPKPLRIACAVFDLLSSLEGESARERIRALRAVREEVLHNGSPTLRMNTARVLLQIMKELVRTQGDGQRQLELAYDFKMATSGRPRLIRRLLREHHLLEMPEAWNQMAFDFHVHDANTKGRKTPTHLIMDAWIKGIRYLGVIYYNYLSTEAVAELLEASEVMGVHLRIGVELPALYRGRIIPLIWAPRGFHSGKDFINFLQEPGTRELMDQGREAARYFELYLIRLLHSFNERHLPGINRELGLSVPPLEEGEFFDFVGLGQASLLHLAELVHAALLPHLRQRAQELNEGAAGGSGPERAQAHALVQEMNLLVPEAIAERYLAPEVNPHLPDPRLAPRGPDMPELLRLDLRQVLERIERAPRGNRTILNPSGLTPEDVLEILYQGEGKITHVEVFNLKDWTEQGSLHLEQISSLRQALNRGNVAETKRLCLEILQRVETGDGPEQTERVESIRGIIRDIPRLHSFYSHSHLKSRLGSDSTGRSRKSRGMGMVVVPTLGWRARRRVRLQGNRLPVRTTACRQVTHTPRSSQVPLVHHLLHALRHLPLLWPLGCSKTLEWLPEDNSTTPSPDGNIAALGGLPEETDNGLCPQPRPAPAGGSRASILKYLNTPLRNLLKVGLGFLPAFLTFFLTKEWWVLAWLGAPIWFTVTGLRNIVQSVVGGGGLVRSPLLRWNDLVSWSRVSDSLLFTGFSVPLLDFLVKQVLLDRYLGITTATGPLLLYSAIALANGIYISSHNLFRGLPPAAAAGNFFRTVLSIPIALGINHLILFFAVRAGVPSAAANAQLQLWAAVISKVSSDMVAGVIEGLADRGQNMALRELDLRDKQQSLTAVVGSLEVLFPERELLELLSQPKELLHSLKGRDEELMRQLTINALDLMYFWLCQPRGQQMLRRILDRTLPDERLILLRAQRALERKRYISGLLLAGLVGKRFDRALAFYLSRVEGYLAQLQRLEKVDPGRGRPGQEGTA